MKITKTITSFLNDITARGLSPQTWKRYHDDLHDLEKFLRRRSTSQIDQVNTDKLRAYLANLLTKTSTRKKRFSEFTVEGKYRSIKTFFNFCHAEKYIAENPMTRVRRIKLPKRIVPRLSENEIESLLEKIHRTKDPSRNLAIILLMIDSGLRRAEAIELKIRNVNLKERKIRVMGKGRKEREIPISQATTCALEQWINERPKSQSENIFVKPNGEPLHYDAIRSLFIRLKKQIGLPRLYPHLLRHSFAKLYLKRGDAKSLQQIL